MSFNETNTLESINEWFNRARPNPDAKAFNVQLGCHFEEVAEMIKEIFITDEAGMVFVGKNLVAYHAIHGLAERLKSASWMAEVTPENRKDFLDSLADQIVTAVGVGNHAKMDVPEACARVDDSNWSKFVEGQPQFNEQGKIAKGKDYFKADLEGCY